MLKSDSYYLNETSQQNYQMQFTTEAITSYCLPL